MKKIAAFATAMVLALTAQADLKNVSANGLNSNLQGFVACTIVDEGTTLLAGGVLLYAFAEAQGNGNPLIRVWSLNRDLAITNDNWQDGIDIHEGGRTQHLSLREIDTEKGNPYGSLLRNPYKVTDAAAVFLARPGEAVCAESRDATSGALLPVSVAITDINSIAFFKSRPSMAKNALAAVPAAAVEQILKALPR